MPAPMLSPANSVAWTPIGAEKTANGYEVAWKYGTADQYILRAVDSGGNWTSQSGVMSSSGPVDPNEPS